MARNDNLQDLLRDTANAIREKKGTTDLINPQDFPEEIASISGGEEEWQPDADMVWAKSVCENDINPDFNSKILVMIDDASDNTVLQLKYGSAIKTSDGAYYTYDDKGSTSFYHIWDDTNARQSEVGDYKIRWIIFYNGVYNILLQNTIYACFDNILIGNVFQSNRSIQYFDAINGSKLSESGDRTFKDCYNLMAVKNLDVSNRNVLEYLFQNCFSLKYVSIINTGNVINVENMFNNCKSLKKVELPRLEQVTSLKNMFYQCYSIYEISLDVPLVDSIEFICYQCYSLYKITLNVGNYFYAAPNAFNGCNNLKIVNINNVSNLTNCGSMFYLCYNLSEIPFDLNNVQDGLSMFRYSSIRELNNVNLSSLMRANTMFANTQISKVNLQNLQNLQLANNMFDSCPNLYELKLKDTINMTSASTIASPFTTVTNRRTLKTIEMDLSNCTSSDILNGCTALEDLYLTNISHSLRISYSTRYTRETLVNVLNNLVDLSGGTAQTLTMGNTNLNKLTNEDKAIATNKNWTLG